MILLSFFAIILLCVCACFGCYQGGKAAGMAFGYAQGLRVASAWEKRAKACEESKTAL